MNNAVKEIRNRYMGGVADLVRIKQNGYKQLVSARDLHEFLESKERFSKWFEKFIDYGFEENVDYTPYQMVHPKNNQEITDYVMTIEMSKEISMISKLPKGKEARKYFIECEKAWNSPEAVMARALQMANRTLENYKEKVNILENKIAEDAPRVGFAETIEKASDDILFRDMAKILSNEGYKIGERKLYDWARSKSLIMKNGTQPTQKAVDMGLFRVDVRVIKTVKGDRETMTTKVTGKGQIYILDKIKKEI